MNADSELLTAVKDSFAKVRLNAPLDATVRRGRNLRARHRMAGLAAAAVVIAGGAALATVMLLPGGAAPPAASGPHPAASGTRPGPAQLTAWTVTKGPGDTVTILIRELRDPAGMQRTLRADGVPAHVAFQGGMLSDTPPLPRNAATPRYLPNRMPRCRARSWAIPSCPRCGTGSRSSSTLPRSRRGSA